MRTADDCKSLSIYVTYFTFPQRNVSHYMTIVLNFEFSSSASILLVSAISSWCVGLALFFSTSTHMILLNTHNTSWAFIRLPKYVTSLDQSHQLGQHL